MNAAQTISQTRPPIWNARQVALSVPVALVLQVLFLPSLGSDLTLVVALTFDGLILVRALIAHLLRERGRSWIFYVLLSYTSVFWLDHLTELIVATI